MYFELIEDGETIKTFDGDVEGAKVELSDLLDVDISDLEVTETEAEVMINLDHCSYAIHRK